MRLRTLRRGAAWSLALAGLVTLVACQASAPKAVGSSTTSVVPPSSSVSSAAAAPAKSRHHRPRKVMPVVRPVTRAFLGASWHHGCPVPPSDLRAVTTRYLGFDGRDHVGTLVVNADAVGAIRTVFRSLRRVRFPVRRMRPVTAYGASDHRSVQHDNTSAFNCRFAVATGPKHWSEHAFGEAVDLDPRENPYVQPGQSPSGYGNRTKVRTGMILARGPVVRAFDAVGWGWGGLWAAPDYQHFSVNGH